MWLLGSIDKIEMYRRIHKCVLENIKKNNQINVSPDWIDCLVLELSKLRTVFCKVRLYSSVIQSIQRLRRI